MKLLDEIIDLSAGGQGSVATLLRKCLVLAHTLKNDRLKTWAASELDGYKADGWDDTAVPEYRKTPAPAKGFFVGAFGSQINSQPIPPGCLQKEHKCFAESALLLQPIASYEGTDPHATLHLEWPANLTLLYQGRFFEGYVLNRAWQEIPGTVLVGLIDTVRTRLLRFALELKDELGSVGDDPNELPKGKIDQQVVTYIFGGTNVIASTNVTQVGTIEIEKGDWSALADALTGLGVGATAVSALKSALDHDSTAEPTRGLGRRAADWLKGFGKKSSAAALSVGVEVAKKEITRWILGYLGFPTRSA
jgi:hypothetical protein